MQHLTKYTFSEYNYSIIEYNGEHYIKDIYSFQMKEGEPLKIDLLENENNYSNIFENSEDVFNFKDSNISACQNFLQINDNFDSEKELEIHSRENSDKKDINSFKEQIDYDSSNDQCLFLLNLTNSSLKESRKNRKKIFDVIYPEKSNFDFNRSENTKRIIFIKRRRRDKKDNILQKIKRAFFNNYLYNRINNLLKIGKKSHKFFYRFSKKFIIDMVKKNIIKNF